MEIEYFVKPEETVAKATFDYFKKLRLQWYIDLGINKDRLRFREHASDERAHYAQIAQDIEYNSPFGWKEFEGIHHRGDWDLSRHKLVYTDPDTGKKFIPLVIETSAGAD
jgi:glycyl-tRNA synthetase